MINKNIALVTAITELSIKISTASIIDVFVEYSSHTKGFNVRVMLEGWNEEPTTDLNKTIYIDWPDSEEELNKVLDYLRKIKEEL